MKTSRFDDLDRAAVEYVVTCVYEGTRFYVADSPGDPATDILERAKRFRYPDDAVLFAGARHLLTE